MATSVLGISGSLRSSSYNTAALRAAQSMAQDGMTIEIADISDVPLYNEEVYQQGFPPAVEALREKIRAADALLIATPEYNYSFSGVLKNAIDWASRPPSHPFDGKVVGVIGASAGRFGTARAQYHLRQVFVFLNGQVLNKPEVMIAAAGKAFDEDGTLTDEFASKGIKEMLDAIAKAVTARR